MMEALDRYLRAGFFWFWICVGVLLAFNSYDSYGSGLGAAMFGSSFLFTVCGDSIASSRRRKSISKISASSFMRSW